jgi:hypothetical protein
MIEWERRRADRGIISELGTAPRYESVIFGKASRTNRKIVIVVVVVVIWNDVNFSSLLSFLGYIYFICILIISIETSAMKNYFNLVATLKNA